VFSRQDIRTFRPELVLHPVPPLAHRYCFRLFAIFPLFLPIAFVRYVSRIFRHEQGAREGLNTLTNPCPPSAEAPCNASLAVTACSSLPECVREVCVPSPPFPPDTGFRVCFSPRSRPPLDSLNCSLRRRPRLPGRVRLRVACLLFFAFP